MKKIDLKINFIFNLISQIVTLIVPLATTPYLARIFYEEGNGRISFSNSIVTWFILIANLGFVVYGQRLIASQRDDKDKLSKCFWEIVILKLFFSFISILLLFVLCFINVFGNNYNSLILILGIQVFACIFDISFFYQGIENFKILAIRTTIIKLIGLVGVFCLVKEESDLWIYCSIISVSNIIANLSMWPSVLKKVKHINIKQIELKKHIIPSLMIFLPTLAATFYCVFDKTMIGLLSKNPDYDNGCYEQAYKINSIALVLITVISPVLTPRNIYDYHNKNFDSLKEHLYFSANYTWIISIPMIMGFVVLSKNLSSWFLGPGYADVPLLMQIMSVRFVLTGFTETFGTQYFIAIGKESRMTISTTIAATINIVLNLFFIRFWGAIGAAISTAITEFVNTIILVFFIKKEKIISLSKILRISWKYLIAGSIMMFCIFIIQKGWNNYSMFSFICLVALGSLVYILILLMLRDKFIFDLIKKVLNFVKERRKKVV